MGEVSLKSFIQTHKRKYQNIGEVFCPYINDIVWFTSSGFKHLLWKSEMGMRPASVIQNRLTSLPAAVHILKQSGTLQEFEDKIGKMFWCFIAIIQNKKYKVVITQGGDGRYKFVSVIPRWKTGIRDYKK